MGVRLNIAEPCETEEERVRRFFGVKLLADNDELEASLSLLMVVRATAPEPLETLLDPFRDVGGGDCCWDIAKGLRTKC